MPAKKRSYVAKIQRQGYVFILPTLVFFSIFLIFPMINAFQLSFFEWNLLGPKVFVGLKNFKRLITDQRVLNSFWRTIHFSAFSVAGINILAFAFALIFSNRMLKARNFLQAMIFLPVVLSTVAIGVVWQFMFQTTGILSVLTVGLFGETIPWLTSTQVAPYGMIMVYVWKFTGFYLVIYIAGLLDIPEVLFEAARIDGASFWQQLFRITIPSLKNTIALALVSCVIFTFGTFAIQFVITEGGPSRSTEVLALLIYFQAFRFNKFGYSAVVSVLFFLTLLVFSIIQLRLFKQQD
jgi:ABC-type sugar transport system permease subunit